MNDSCSRTRALRSLFLFSILLLAGSASATIFGTVRGTVRDAQDRPVAGAAVVLQSQTAQWRREQKTDANGAFSFAAVALGSYKLQVEAAGLASSARSLVLHSGEVLWLRTLQQILNVLVDVSTILVDFVHGRSGNQATLRARILIAYRVVVRVEQVGVRRIRRLIGGDVRFQ